MHISLDTKNIIPNPFRSSSRVIICNYADIIMIFCELEIILTDVFNPFTERRR